MLTSTFFEKMLTSTFAKEMLDQFFQVNVGMIFF
jgi:hypothetical protein